ncbi:hypothetical protein, partial [Pedobacter sp. ASV12]|uniref:hypothetical protein n=1 Tax=Pedobacter sp. ASV12 TaxID=2795120 RepID=UPI0018EB84E7
GTNETSPKYAFESFEDFPNAVSRTGLGSLLGTYVLKENFTGLMYIYLDLWVNGTNIPIVSYNNNMTATSYSMVMQIGDWKLYRYALPYAPLANITINSNGSYVDDVRALPLGTIGAFSTYTYSKGLLRASSNEREQLTFYEYDSFNRLKTIK